MGISSVSNRALGRASMFIYLDTDGPWFRCLADTIQQEAEATVLEKTKAAFESGKRFKE